MAEFAANLTSQHLPEAPISRPSIFELLAQESLCSGLRRAAVYLAKVLYQQDPVKFNYLYHHFDNIYLVFDLIVQYSYLRTVGASFAENFYGLKRIDKLELTKKLSPKQFYLSLVLLVGYPYIKLKLDNLYEQLKYALLDNQIKKHSDPTQYAFVKTYPTFCSLINYLFLYYQLSYAVSKNDYHSPLTQLACIKLKCQTQDDINSLQVNASEPNLSWYKYLKRISWLSTKWCATGLGAALSFGAFFIQFLDYWYTRESRPPSFAEVPIPPPPAKERIEIPIESCPICLRRRRNDTALATSGFVFCYSCVNNFIIKNGRCPVTGYPSTTNHLIKLYPPD